MEFHEGVMGMDLARLGTAGRCALASPFSVVAVVGSNDPIETAETAPVDRILIGSLSLLERAVFSDSPW